MSTGPESTRIRLARAHRTPDGDLCAYDHPHPDGICDGSESSGRPETGAPRRSDREYRVSLDRLHGLAQRVIRATTHTRNRDVTWLTRDGMKVAAIIPAENYHPPSGCCCKNCPWGGSHG